MATYVSLGRQGFFDKFAQAGNALRNMVGLGTGLYDRYKTGGLEDQRRQEMEIQKKQSQAALDYLSKQSSHLTTGDELARNQNTRTQTEFEREQQVKNQGRDLSKTVGGTFGNPDFQTADSDVQVEKPVVGDLSRFQAPAPSAKSSAPAEEPDPYEIRDDSIQVNAPAPRANDSTSVPPDQIPHPGEGNTPGGTPSVKPDASIPGGPSSVADAARSAVGAVMSSLRSLPILPNLPDNSAPSEAPSPATLTPDETSLIQPPAGPVDTAPTALPTPEPMAPPTPRMKSWNELSPELRTQVTQLAMQANPTLSPGMVQQFYESQVAASFGNVTPTRMQLSPDAMIQLGSQGIDPRTIVNPKTGTANPLDVGGQLADRYKNLMSGGNSVEVGSDGIPYAQWVWMPDPKTGNLTRQRVEIPAEARQTAIKLMSQGGLNFVTDQAEKFSKEPLVAKFKDTIAPNYQAIQNLITEGKQTGDWNNWRKMDVINAYAQISRPGAVVRDSSIEMDLEGAGIPNHVARAIGKLYGTGIISDKDVKDIDSAASNSYQGYLKQVEALKRPYLNRASVRTGFPATQLQSLMFPEDRTTGDTGHSAGGGGSQPVYARNPQSGARVVSTDGGRTWQPVK